MKEYPVIRSIKTTLVESGADLALMSGSGATVFGIFKEKSVAQHALQNMEQPDWLVVVTSIQQRKNTVT